MREVGVEGECGCDFVVFFHSLDELGFACVELLVEKAELRFSCFELSEVAIQ